MAKKILIVEDNESNRFLFSTFLREYGYNIIEARNGLEGIRVAKREKPHLILMDIQMPIMDGFEALKVLRSESTTKDIPSIALTSYHLPEGKDGFIRRGFIDHIRKPVNIKDLIRIVNGYMNQDFRNLT